MPEIKNGEQAAVAADNSAVDTLAKNKAATESKADDGVKVGDLFADKKEEKLVPESILLEFKKENKAVWNELKKTQELIAEGLSKREVSEKLKQIGEKYKVDPNFLDEVSRAIRVEAEEDTTRKVSKNKPEDDDEPKAKADKKATDSERIDRIFNDNFDKTLASMPEFKDIADRDVIKSLTLDPANSSKTFAQIIEKAYGHLVQGKGKTFDQNKPGGDKGATEIDYDKASKDSDYFRSIMADPASRKEYNANLHKRLKL